jgi:aminoglycoside 6-adenylyltransferase
LKQQVRPEFWAELELTYTGAGLEENWEALFRTVALMRRVANEVGKHLGYTYPQELEQRVLNYLSIVKRLDRHAKTFD